MLSLLASITQSWPSVCYFFGSKVAMKFIVGRCGARSICRYFHLFCLKWEILSSKFTVSPDADLIKVIFALQETVKFVGIRLLSMLMTPLLF